MVLIMILAALSTAAPHQDEHLKAFEWLVGNWEGGGRMDQMEFTATVGYEWTLNKNFIKVNYEAKAGGQVVWADTGMFGWDKDKKKLVSFSFALDGSIGQGEWEEGKEKNTWIVSVKINSEDPRFRDGRAVLKKVDDDTYTEDIQTRKDDKWVTFMSCSYKRKKEKK